VFLFVSDSGLWPVAGIDDCFVGQREEFFFDTLGKCVVAAAWKVASSDGIGEEGVVSEDDAVGLRVQAYPAGGVAWGMQDSEFEPGLFQQCVVFEEYFSRSGRKVPSHHGGKISLRIGKHIGIKSVNCQLHVGVVAAKRADAFDMVDMAVCENDDDGIQVVLAEKV